MRRLLSVTAAALLCTLAAPAQESQPAAPPANTKAKAEPRKKIYDEQADARKLLADALAAARPTDKRVLLMYGGNWCGWCHLLHECFAKNPAIATLLRDEYELVMVDIGHFDKHQDLVKELGAQIKGVPFLTVLDKDGKVLTHQPTEPLEKGKAHDPAKVKAFLEQWAAPARDAEVAYAAALQRAAAEGKMVFLHFGAPWCGWCHKLEAWLAQPEIAQILRKDFVELKIDEDRMKGGKDVEQRFRPAMKGGIPWIAFLDATGKVLVDSDGPGGNTGFPAEPQEVDHFMAMLKKTVKNITAGELAAIEQSLRPAPKK